MADPFNRILSKFCDTFKSLDFSEHKNADINCEDSGYDEAVRSLENYVKDKAKRNKETGYLRDAKLDEALVATENLPYNADKTPLEKLYIKRERILEIKECFEKLARHIWVIGSVFVGAGTAKYWKGMAKHCDELKKQINDCIKEVIKTQNDNSGIDERKVPKDKQFVYSTFCKEMYSGKTDKGRDLPKNIKDVVYAEKNKTAGNAYERLPARFRFYYPPDCCCEALINGGSGCLISNDCRKTFQKALTCVKNLKALVSGTNPNSNNLKKVINDSDYYYLRAKASAENISAKYKVIQNILKVYLFEIESYYKQSGIILPEK